MAHYRIREGEGEHIVNGRTEYPDLIQVTIDAHTVLSWLVQIAHQLQYPQHGADGMTFAVFGTLKVVEDDPYGVEQEGG